MMTEEFTEFFEDEIPTLVFKADELTTMWQRFAMEGPEPEVEVQE